MDGSKQEEEKNDALNSKKNKVSEENNKSHSLSVSLSVSNSYNEKEDQILKMRNELNFLM